MYVYESESHIYARPCVKMPNDRHYATVARIRSISRESFDLAPQNSSPNGVTERESRGDHE